MGGKYRNLHGIDKAHKLLDIGFPLPYFTVFVGYTLILLIDKVLFESHSMEHEHLRESFHSIDPRIRSQSHAEELQQHDKEFIGNNRGYNVFKDEDEAREEEEISEGIRKFLSTADRFSKKMSTALSKKYKKGVKMSRDSNRMRSNTGNPTPSSLKSEIEIIQKDDDFNESGHKENY